MNLTKNFSLAEFASRDGSPTPPAVIENLKALAEQLQIIRDYVGHPIKVNSGYRSPAYNKAVGGAQNSQHLLGKAADICIAGKDPEILHFAIQELILKKKIKNGGLGLYKTFVHYDIRPGAARWYGN
jgi:uncharacterized protein YcbK (DUF882 family)